MASVIILAGAPRVALDAVRFMTVHASGTTAHTLAEALRRQHIPVTVIASPDACPSEVDAIRYCSREDLDAALKQQLQVEPDSVVVSSAAINDYQLAAVESACEGSNQCHHPEHKISSGAEEVVIRLRPAPKLVDKLPSWGHIGSLVAFKYEDASTVKASAQKLLSRVGAKVVVANSLCGTVQALVDGDGICDYANRDQLMAALADRVTVLSKIPVSQAS